MSHFEIAATVYSVLSTIGLALTVYFGRKFLMGIEQSIQFRLIREAADVRAVVMKESASLHERSEMVASSVINHAEDIAECAKADISRVEKWITDHAKELKARAEDLRVRALDLHDKTNAGLTRQPPIR